MRTSACVVAVAALAARPTAARADGGYAERMIAIDATADTLIVAGLVSEHDWAIYAGLASYALGGPILHAAHDEWPRAGVSLGVRLGLPLATGALGDARLANQMAARLLELGIYVIGFSFPVVPKGAARIRVQLSAAHSEDDVDRAVAAFAQVGKELGVVA